MEWENWPANEVLRFRLLCYSGQINDWIDTPLWEEVTKNFSLSESEQKIHESGLFYSGGHKNQSPELGLNAQ